MGESKGAVGDVVIYTPMCRPASSCLPSLSAHLSSPLRGQAGDREASQLLPTHTPTRGIHHPANRVLAHKPRPACRPLSHTPLLVTAVGTSSDSLTTPLSHLLSFGNLSDSITILIV